MTRRLHSVWRALAIAPVALFATAPLAEAQTVQELLRRIEDLEAKQKQAETKPAPAPAPQDAVTAGSFPGSFKLPGTDTSVKIGGYAKLDVIVDAKAATGDSVTFPAIPVDGTAAAGRDGQTRLHARQSRVNLETRTPTGWGDLRTFVEGDFFGDGGNERISNSHSFRLRHAYGVLGPVLAGQTWSTFMDLGSLPETVDFNGPTGQSFIRQAQLRYTHALNPNTTLAVAIENPEGDFTDDSLVTNANVLDQFPDFTGNLTHRGQWGHVSLRGVVRQIRSDAGNGVADDDVGYGLGLSGSFATFGKDRILYHFNYGDGIGRYIQDAVNLGAAFRRPGSLETQVAYGGFVGYQHFWTNAIRSTVVYGHTEIDNDTVTLGTGVTKSMNSLHANIFWSPIPRVDLGLEYIYGQRELENGSEGDISRFQFGALYRF